MSIQSLSALPSAIQIAGFDKQLRRRAVLQDIYVNKRGLYDSEQKSIPNAIYMQVSTNALAGSNYARIVMKLPLVGAPVVGNSRFDNTEEAPRTKWSTVYRNNYGKTVRVESYGVRKLDQEPYGLYKEHIDDLGEWGSQYEGMEIRMALCECFGYSLWWGDTQTTCTPLINSNVHIGGLMWNNQPAYHPTLSTYTNNIVAKMLEAGGGSLSPTASQAAAFGLFNNVALRALDIKIWPFKMGNRDSYMLVVSPLFATIYADPTWTNSGGSQWIQFTNLPKETQNWYGIHGVFHSSIGVDIYIVVDQKHPTVLPSGTGVPYSLSFGYVWPGDNDLRNLSNPNTRDVNVLLGRSAVMRWEPERVHFIKQDDNYYKIMGHGIAGVRGIQQVRFDDGTQSATSLEYYGSMLVLTARPTNYV